MTTQSAALHTDTTGTPTSSEYGDPGDGTADWYHWARVADGGNTALGATDDAAETDPTATATLLALVKGLLSRVGIYPPGATPLAHSSGNVAASSAVATLAAGAGARTYITGFAVTFAGATSAANVTVTVAGPATSLSYTITAPAGATAAGAPLVVQFPYPIPASADNTAITVTVPSLGTGNTHCTVTATGFRL